MAEMDLQLVTLIEALNVPEAFQKLLLDKKILDATSYALLASDEKEIKTEIIGFAKSAGVDMDDIADAVAVKKLWMSCR